ncbi:MAG: hypothetical protein HY023_09170 [Chloroflexi bacterium]|nr:hypothetical protein [Chloroflexota bacterium]
MNRFKFPLRLLFVFLLAACGRATEPPPPTPPVAFSVPPPPGLPVPTATQPPVTPTIPAATPAGFTGQPIAVDAGDPLGPASAIGDFVGIQGPPNTVDWDDPDVWVVEAWRNLGLSAAEVALFREDDDYSVVVTRNAQGKIDLDFTRFDKFLGYLLNALGARQVRFSTIFVPRALSSKPDDPGYPYYSPKDYKEWADVVTQTVTHLQDKWGLTRQSFQTWTEPETYRYWRGHSRKKDDPKLLQDFVEHYVNTWRAIKAADPTAKVGGPMTIYSDNGVVNQPWGFEDFVRELAAYNTAHPDAPVTLDEAVWQDYDWAGSGRLAGGAAKAREALAKYSFPADTPLIVAGWNTDKFNYPKCGNVSLPYHASFAAASIIHELSSGSTRDVTQAYWWPFEYDWGCAGLGLVTYPVSEFTVTDPTGANEPFTIPTVTEYCKRPAYAAFEMLKAMEAGKFVGLALPAGSTLEAMAVRDDSAHHVIAIVANHAGADQAATLTFNHLPFGAEAVTGTLQQIDKTHSADCKGLEAGTRSRIAVSGGAVEVTLSLPAYSVAQITLEP